MATQVSPYLSFNGKCREAMTFYKECFGGELTLMTVKDTPIAQQCPTGMQDHIMHAMLSQGDFVIMGTDMTGPAGHIAGTDMSLSLNFDSEQEINRCYNFLSEGGQVLDTLKESFWGSLFGVVLDKFGKVWMFNYEIRKGQH